MKTFGKTLFILLAVVLILALVGCDKIGTDEKETTAEETAALTVVNNITIITADGNTDYQLVRSEDSESDVTERVSALYKDMRDKFGIPYTDFKFQTDWEKPGAVRPAHEILIGQTNREESQEIFSRLHVYDYAIAMVNEKLVICGGSAESTLQAIDYFYNNILTASPFELPDNFKYFCQSPPRVVSSSPENLYYYEDVYTPTITVNYVCSPALDKAATKLEINGKDYTSSATITDESTTLSGVTFEAGDYDVVLTLCDTSGNTYKHTQKFSCGDGSAMNLYRGEVHAHTSESDGQGTVADAYTYARDVAHLDFFAVTDHSNSIDKNTLQYTHARLASEFTVPGKYVALYGYEQTYNISSGYYGHLNVLNSLTFCTRSTSNLTQFYKIMSKSTSAVVMFNHPGYTWGNFLEYENYSEDIDKVLNLSEIKGSGYDNEYALSLTKGWHVSPMYNEDNHSANWGTAKDAVSYALAPALTRENILEAFRKNRTYTTTDSTLKIYFKVNDEWMGARLDNPDSLRITADISTSRASGLGVIYLMAEDNIIVAQAGVGSGKTYTWDITVSPEYDYYYIKVAGGESWAVTAPVWIENRSLLNITDMTQSLALNNDGNSDCGVTALFKNTSEKAITDVTVSFYQSSLSGFALKATPFATVNVGTIAAGGTADATAFTSFSYSQNRVSAVVSGKIDGKVYTDTSYLMLTPLYMTEVLPSMSAYNGVTNPFVYVELYNNSDTELDLSSYSIKYYPKAGANATDLASHTWKLSGTIQPHSTMVVWMRISTKLTVADFNAKFGTNLTEGKDIMLISVTEQLAVKNAVQLELVCGNSIASRIWYNWGDTKLDVKSDKAITYDYPHLYRLTSKMTSNSAAPTPGTLTEGQVPKEITK